MDMNLNLNEKSGYTKDSRGERIEYDGIVDVINIIRDKAPHYYDMIKGGNLPEYQQLYRGLANKPNGNFVSIYKPSEFNRESSNTLNYYTEIMDNSKYWELYPKRSLSMICTTDINKAKIYGNVYNVIPLNKDSKFGIAPESDLWYSFDFALNTLDKLLDEELAIQTATPDFNHLGGLTNFLKTKFNLRDDATYKELVRNVKLNDKVFSLLDRESTWTNSKFIYDKKELIKIQDKWGTFLNFIEYLLSPKWNKFSLLNYNNKVVFPNNREVWTDSDCLLIETSLHEKILSELA